MEKLYQLLKTLFPLPKPQGKLIPIPVRVKSTWLLVIIFAACYSPASANYTVASGTTVNASTITAQSGLLTVNGTLYVDQNVVSLLNFTSVVVNGPNGQIYWNGNYDLKFQTGISFDINSSALGLQPTAGNGNSSTRLYIGSTIIAVSSDNSQNAAFSFEDFNAAGGLPKFTLTSSPSSPATICYGNPFTITLTPIDNIVPFDCTWSVNNSGSISPSSASGFTTAQTATITPTSSTVSKIYTITCTIYDANNSNDPITSKTVSVTVKPLPSIASIAGGANTVCVSAVTPAFTDANSGGTWSVTNGSGSASITSLGVLTGLGPGTANIIYTYSDGVCSNLVTRTVTINPATSIDVQPSAPSATCSGSGTQTMSVTATGSALTYSWRKAGTPLVNGGVISGQGTSTLTLTNPTSANAGSYDVVVSGSCNSATSASVNVTVNAVTAITTNPSTPAATCSGTGTQTMNVTATGTGILTYNWRKGGVAVVNGGVISGQGTASLTLTGPVAANAGSYDVVVSGTCNSATSTAVNVTVNASTPGSATWTGSVSSDWCNSANWACGNMPGASTNAVIPASAAIMPVISGTCNAYVKDLDVQGTATLNLEAGRGLDIYGSVINTNPANYTLNGTVTFAGISQNIPGLTFKGLTISGGGNKTLVGNVTVGGTLILNNGIVKTTGGTTLTVAATGNITAANSLSYIDGPLTRITNSSSSYSFPTGKNAKLRAASLTPANNQVSTYTVQYYAAAPVVTHTLGTALTAVQQNEYWDITRNSGVTDATAALDYENPNALAAGAGTTDWSNGVNPCSSCNIALAVNDGAGNWSFTGNSSAGFASNESTFWQSGSAVNSRQLVGAFAQYSFGYGYSVILPVRLVSFTGTRQVNTALLEWAIAAASDLAGFELQHSIDGKNYVKLAEVAPSSANKYRFDHWQMSAGANYYRLLIKDKTGKISYSATVLLVAGTDITIIKGLRPTLVQNEAFVDIHSAKAQGIHAVMLDVAGRTAGVFNGMLIQGNNNVRINTQRLSKGVYTMQVRTGDEIVTNLRFIKE